MSNKQRSVRKANFSISTTEYMHCVTKLLRSLNDTKPTEHRIVNAPCQSNDINALPVTLLYYTWLSSKKFISSTSLSMSANLGRDAGTRVRQRRAMFHTGCGQFDGQTSGYLALPPAPAASDSNIASTSASERSASGRGHWGVNSSQMTTPNDQTSAGSVGRSAGCVTVSGAAQRSGSGRRR